MAVALEKLEEQLNCSICLETYTNPKLLQCNHVYCQQCLVKLVFRNQQGKLVLTCPNCCQVTLVPTNGVAGLKAAFQVNKFLEILEEHKKVIPATASIEKVNEAIASSTPNQGNVVCPEHGGKEVDLYCETCGETICWKCIMKGSKHHSHEYQELNKAFKCYKEEIASLLEPVEEQLITIKKALSRLDACHDEISNQQEAIETDIHSTFTRLQETLDVRKTELISQLHQLTQAKLKSLAVQKDQIETTQAQLNSCLLFMRENLTTSNEREALLMKDTTVRQVKELITIFQPDIFEPNAEADIIFSGLTDLAAMCQSCGKVCTPGLPVPSKCFATGKGVYTATVGEKSTALLHTVSFDNQPSKETINSISCEFVSGLTGFRVGGSTERREQSQYQISYQPTIKGRHQLHIKVEGQHIRGSPFPVTAMSPVENLGTPILNVGGGIEDPSGVVINKSGEVIVTEYSKHCVTVFSPRGAWLRSFGTYGIRQGQFWHPRGVAVDSNGCILVADSGNHRIQKFTAKGEFLLAVGTEGSGLLQFALPHGIAVNGSSNNLLVYVLNANNIAQILNEDLSYFGSFGKKGSGKEQFSNPQQLAFDSTGNVYVTDSSNHRIQVFTAEGKFLRMFGKHGKGKGELNLPWGVAIDSNDRVYISEHGNRRISVFTLEGQFLSSFNERSAGRLAVDSGVLYVCDSKNKCIKLF